MVGQRRRRRTASQAAESRNGEADRARPHRSQRRIDGILKEHRAEGSDDIAEQSIELRAALRSASSADTTRSASGAGWASDASAPTSKSCPNRLVPSRQGERHAAIVALDASSSIAAELAPSPAPVAPAGRRQGLAEALAAPAAAAHLRGQIGSSRRRASASRARARVDLAHGARRTGGKRGRRPAPTHVASMAQSEVADRPRGERSSARHALSTRGGRPPSPAQVTDTIKHGRQINDQATPRREWSPPLERVHDSVNSATDQQAAITRRAADGRIGLSRITQRRGHRRPAD